MDRIVKRLKIVKRMLTRYSDDDDDDDDDDDADESTEC